MKYRRSLVRTQRRSRRTDAGSIPRHGSQRNVAQEVQAPVWRTGGRRWSRAIPTKRCKHKWTCSGLLIRGFSVRGRGGAPSGRNPTAEMVSSNLTRCGFESRRPYYPCPALPESTGTPKRDGAGKRTKRATARPGLHQYQEGCWHPALSLEQEHAGSIPALVAMPL